MSSNGYCRKRIENYSYSLQDQIGKGFSSMVYKGTNDSNSQPVAIKVINLKQVKDGLAKIMLDNQVECLRQFNHPNLLKFQTTLSTINNYYIITQLCQGGDLANKLKSKGKFTQQQFIPIFKDIFQGYRMLYCYGYVHRDLKPANMLLKQNTIKIADFGFVKKSLNGLRCQESYNVGTPIYMSPQSMKYNVYTYKSDIWSMGVMFYELLTGATPWNCKNQRDLREKIQTAKIDYSQLQVSSELKDLIKRCLEIDQNKRISIGDMQNQDWVKKVFRESSKNQTKQNPEQQQGSKQNNQKAIDVLKSYLNFARYIYRIINNLSKTNINHQLKNRIEQELSTNLLYCLNFHKEIISTKNGVDSIPKWRQFIDSCAWNAYKSVVASYYSKYESKINNKIPLSYNKQIILKFIKEILSMASANKQSIVCLDLLVSYYQLVQLLQRTNWNYVKFMKYSKIDRIMQGGPNENLDDDGLFQSVKWKLYRMGILN